MKIKTRDIVITIVALIVAFGLWKFMQNKSGQKTVIEEVKPTRADMQLQISTTGTVQPQNRLEMKPPINGRIEEILVKEGEKVQRGQIVAWMSSTERAALLDAARSKGADNLQYWEEAYKPTPLIAPIDGDVIVRSVEPGQTVTSADPIIVLSDRLIVKAQVDETDIAGVKVGQSANISLDAYPKEKVKATIDHISYESKLINNVTIYEVDVLPEEVPDIFRSGMTANVQIIQQKHENVLRVPLEAIKREKKGTFLLIKEKGQRKAQTKAVELGIADNNFIEIKEGLTDEDIVLVERKKLNLPKKGSGGSSPFMPGGGNNRRQR